MAIADFLDLRRGKIDGSPARGSSSKPRGERMNRIARAGLVLMLVASVASGSKQEESAPAPTKMQINGAGSTFVFPIMSKWTAEYANVKPNVQINYQPIGSGGGIRQTSEGTVDFGGTDGPMT